MGGKRRRCVQMHGHMSCLALFASALATHALVVMLSAATVKAEDCLAGSYVSALGCVKCSAGTFSAVTNAKACTNCPRGETSEEGASECTVCPAGSYIYNFKIGSSTTILCSECPAGTFGSKPGSYSCTECAKGYTSAEGQTECTQCPAGSYITALDFGSQKTALCSECPAGSFSNKPGSYNCTECAKGYTSAEGQTECTQCPAGSYITALDFGSQKTALCSECPSGSFSNKPGSYNCTKCAKGYTSDQGATECTQCPAGSYVQNMEAIKLTLCSKCPAGTTSGPASTQCTKCPEGQTCESQDPTSALLEPFLTPLASPAAPSTPLPSTPAPTPVSDPSSAPPSSTLDSAPVPLTSTPLGSSTTKSITASPSTPLPPSSTTTSAPSSLSRPTDTSSLASSTSPPSNPSSSRSSTNPPSNPSSASSSTPTSSPKSNSKTPVGAIVGGTFGALLVVALLAAGGWYWVRRSRTKVKAVDPHTARLEKDGFEVPI